MLGSRGSLGRNAFRGPGYFKTYLSLLEPLDLRWGNVSAPTAGRLRHHVGDGSLLQNYIRERGTTEVAAPQKAVFIPPLTRKRAKKVAARVLSILGY